MARQTNREIGAIESSSCISCVDTETTDDAARASLERYCSFVQLTGQLGWTTNAEGEVVEDIPSFRKFTGQTYEEVKGWGWADAVHPDDRDSALKISREAVKARIGFEVEYRLRRHDGAYRFFMARGVPVFRSDGSVREWVGTCIDITERRLNEEELRKLKDFNERIVNSIEDALVLINHEDFTVLSANEAAFKQLKLTKGDMIGKTCYETTHHRSTPCEAPHHCPIREVLKTGEPAKAEHIHFDENNREIIVEISAYPIKDNNGRIFQIVHVARDVTERRRTENALKESEEKYRLLVELAHEGIWALDKDNFTIFVNSRMAEMLGYANSEMMGKNLLAFVETPNVDGLMQNLESCKEGSIEKCEFKFVRKDGTYVFANVAASPITNDDGNYVGTLALVSDITYRKRMEEKLEQYSRNLEELVEKRTGQLAEAQAQLVKSERLAAIGELAGMIGHDLRNPLAAIKNSSYYLKKKYFSNTEDNGKAMIEIIDKSIEHANRIINDLLDYSREIRLELTECTPQTLLSDALSIVTVPDGMKVTNFTSNEPVLQADVNKIERVFINLIKNAFDAMPNGGTLEIRSLHVNEEAAISFTDTGTGISREVLSKLFAPLFTTKAQGMGFGLAICKRVVEAHGGRITIETEVGKGTTFTVTLPISPKIANGGETHG